ncbi:MAG: DUF937 domain-containing protein [Pseudomonadota bacterium]
MAGTNLFDMIAGAAGGGAMEQVGQQFGLDQSETRGALQALLPAISGGLKRNASSADGLQSLLGALDKGGHDQYIDRPERLGEASTVEDGNAILSHLLGSKEMSRQVAAHASERSGVDSGILKKMLPVVAAMAMGSLSKQSKEPGVAEAMVGALLGGRQEPQSGGGLADLAGSLLGGGNAQKGGLGSLLGSMLGGSTSRAASQKQPDLGLLGGLLDADGDGNAMDDIFNMVLKR